MNMSWICNYTLSWIHKVCFSILKQGIIPKHIAIIMDGNRRFARRNHANKCDGHKKGFDKLTETLQWCLNLEIYEVTVYAFSIGNFKRSQEEVDDLMELAKEKFKTLINEWKKLKEHGICVRVIGNLTFLPPDIQALVITAMLLTSNNTKAFLNVAFSYTGKEELCSTSEDIIRGIENGDIVKMDLSESFIDDCLYTFNSPHPDLIIRTSGEFRISNFVLWQSAHSYLHFVDSLWPEFSIWNFMYAIFSYQQFEGVIKKLVRSSKSDDGSNRSLERQKMFSNRLHDNKFMSVLTSSLDVGILPDVSVVSSYSPEQIYQYYILHVAPFYLLA